MNRRDFINKSALNLALVNVLGLNVANSFAKSNNISQEQNEIIYRKLGRTGLQIPIVNMGVMNANLPNLISQSFDRGVRLFDTAWFYQNGMNEKMIGSVVKQRNIRDKVIISTKVFLKESPRDLYTKEIKSLFLERFEQSLQRLNTDYADILFYHASSDVKEHNNPYIIEAFEELKSNKKVRFTGVSLHGDDAALLDDVVEKQYYDVVMVMFNIALADDQRLYNSIKNAAEKGVGIIAMKTQCGYGNNMWWEKHKDNKEGIEKLNHKAMLKWVLRHPFISTAIPGYTTFEQLEENFSVAYNLDYTEEEKEFIQKTQVALAQSFCRQCGECTNKCPKDVDIPTLMRVFMYAYHYNNIQLATSVEKTIPFNKGITRCIECEQCNAKCVRNININERINLLKELNFA